MAVESLVGVETVKTDTNAHMVTVVYDDEKVQLADIIESLADAGYVARKPKE